MNDVIILKFEVESNLEDVQDTLTLSNEVAEFLKGFKKKKLINVGVEYVWNKEQKVKQSAEFLKANPDYDKPKPKIEPKQDTKRKLDADIEADFYAQDTWKKVKNGGKKNGSKKA